MKAIVSFCVFAFLFLSSNAQDKYQYSVDLTNVKNDQLTVKLVCPAVKTNTINFYLPKIVPGTYMNSNYGKYVHNLIAADKNGKALPYSRINDNGWKIKDAATIATITYEVEDTWFSEIKNKVYTMCGTNFEEGKNFVLNTPGIFGYFEGMKKIPFHLSFTKPEVFYGATGLTAVTSTSTKDEFICNDADHLYDSPIMYSLPDTTTIKVGSTDVLVAIYSPKKLATSKFLADSLKRFLFGAKDYLGGRLPVNKYAFIFYMNGEQPPLETNGAWEHSYSSFYSIPEQPEKEGIHFWIDIAAHEFFHIVTPLTISSREVKEFNFNETVLSKHLWLYEGSTEYYSQHMQVWSGIKTPEQFFENLSNKISYSREHMNDNLSFTELSKESADKHADQYGNVYMKGAMINACLDLYLLKLSNAQYGLRQLKHDLGVKFGKDKFFEDDSLFNIITQLTYPEVRTFFSKYVEGTTSLPYEEFLSYAGVEFIPSEKYKDFTLGGLNLKQGSDNSVFVETDDMNSFGKKMDFRVGDVIYSVNDSLVNNSNIDQLMKNLYDHLKEGDLIRVDVKRKNKAGIYDIVHLSAPAVKIEKERKYVIRFNSNPSPQQLKIRNAWLNNHTATAAVPVAIDADVTTIDGIVKALYDVISGPAGPRNWERFNSLFYPEAYMGAFNSYNKLQKFLPAQYVKANAPYFLKNAFTEKEIGRKTNQFGNIAQVFTTYEYSTTENNKPVTQRGINSVELIKENNRWYIMSVIWDEESKDKALPEMYLKF